MLRRPRFAQYVAAAALLALAACGQAPEQDVQTTDATVIEESPAAAPSEPALGSTAAPTEFCAEVGRRVSAEDCADFAALAEDAAQGTAAFNAPDPMERGEAHTLQLAISFALTQEQIAAREERARLEAERLAAQAEEETVALNTVDSTETVDGREAPPPISASAPAPSPPLTPSETVDPLQGETVEFAPLVGRFMRAELVGNGFEITPLTEASQEVLQDSVTTWSWRVVATEGGRRSLTLRTVVEGCTAEGQCYPLRSTSQNYDVNVTVGLVGQAQDLLTAAPTWLRLVAGVLTALAVLVGAWFGLRNAFRKGRAEA
ncbi:MAG TPA: hypothetical protein VEA80_09560 [Vitreimonas sp.]|uniref:hypothetical protein n=1 Tax=Vitreimonas sp. TaxID=3069702 RepID=UPI002D274B6F|nr:hypothetical protein [Vitreimonas sp.]HYD87710.1 hypothetical protein [Vitreimonas sp.]